MTAEQTAKHWPRLTRGDGRVEIICPHGVGHPVKSLTRNWDDSWMGVHGCDGCCGLETFAAAERYHKSKED